jgi:hypothetical protein
VRSCNYRGSYRAALEVESLDEAALVEQMTAFLKKGPRTWYEMLPYTVADTEFVQGDGEPRSSQSGTARRLSRH